MADSLSSVNKERKRFETRIEEGKPGFSLEGPIRTGKTKKEREAKQAIQKQSQTEAAALAEADDEIARRRAVAGSKRAGRGSLIRSTGSGTATNLGGTA